MKDDCGLNKGEVPESEQKLEDKVESSELPVPYPMLYDDMRNYCNNAIAETVLLLDDVEHDLCDVDYNRDKDGKYNEKLYFCWSYFENLNEMIQDNICLHRENKMLKGRYELESDELNRLLDVLRKLKMAKLVSKEKIRDAINFIIDNVKNMTIVQGLLRY